MTIYLYESLFIYMYVTRESDRVRNMQKEIMEKNKAKIPFSHIQNKDINILPYLV